MFLPENPINSLQSSSPCSADNEDAVLDYLTRLRNVQEKIADKVLIVPRVYTNKPRTTGEGYKGMVHQPDPEKQPNLLAGLVAIRKMHIHAIQTSGMTCADEMLYPENYRYLSDLLSYVAVGARSVDEEIGEVIISSDRGATFPVAETEIPISPFVTVPKSISSKGIPALNTFTKRRRKKQTKAHATNANLIINIFFLRRFTSGEISLSMPMFIFLIFYHFIYNILISNKIIKG